MHSYFHIHTYTRVCPYLLAYSKHSLPLSLSHPPTHTHIYDRNSTLRKIRSRNLHHKLRSKMQHCWTWDCSWSRSRKSESHFLCVHVFVMCIHACMCMYLNVCMYLCVHTCVCMYVCMCVCMYVCMQHCYWALDCSQNKCQKSEGHVSEYVFIYIHIYICMNIREYVHAYTHTCSDAHDGRKKWEVWSPVYT